MQSFIKDVILDLQHKKCDISKLTFILPSKRAGTFLVHELANNTSHTFFSPLIYSIEEFVEELSQLKSISNTELLFELYTIYKSTFKGSVDSFEVFSKWAQVLIQDFNEIDRYLIDEHHIFNYLKAIQEINSNHWSLDSQKSKLITNYLKFWNSLEAIYLNFKNHLLEHQIGYQGLIYREAKNNIEAFIQENEAKHFVFIGFNALNTAEINIIQELLHHDIASIYWDIDKTFIANKAHDAGYFIRQHKQWNYFNKAAFNWEKENYHSQKSIQVIGVPKQVGQAKYIGELLLQLKKTNSNLNNTALVLGDENLIYPILTSIPKAIESVNITMGLPLYSVPLASFFNQLILIQKNSPKKYYYKDVITLLSHPIITSFFSSNKINDAQGIINTINTNNYTHLNCDELTALAANQSILINLLFTPWKNNTSFGLEIISQLIYTLKSQLDLDKAKNRLNLEFLYQFNTVFNTISHLNKKYNYIDSIGTFYNIYKEVLNSETLDFKGEPLKGLQIMGMLESRVLDFETVIITGVNEGILPSGKSNNSFIPFDVKRDNGLPTYKEKDAVYTYHFYHLLQRSKQVFIIYNSESDGLNTGEMSRFITQLEVENIHKIKHSIVSPQTPKNASSLVSIKKTPAIENRLKEIAIKGFSPSALLTYIRNPLDFYYQRVLGIYEHDAIEETVALNTLGTVVHNTLEDLYKPLQGKFLSVEMLKAMKPLIQKLVETHFKKEYKHGDITKGKNLIIFEIAKRYVQNFITSEIEAVRNGNKIKILALEIEKTIELQIPELDFPVILKGKVDRIDLFNDTYRVIDYKTGHVDPSYLNIVNWDDITTDYKKFSKPFQVLTYALIMHQNAVIKLPCEAGIVSLKNLNNGFMPFAQKATTNSRTKDTTITTEVLEAYSKQLKQLIIELFDSSINFNEKEV